MPTNKNIHGRDITPFVLEKLVEKTGGASLKANIQLIRNNARLGARLSVAYSQTNTVQLNLAPLRRGRFLFETLYCPLPGHSHSLSSRVPGTYPQPSASPVPNHTCPEDA